MTKKGSEGAVFIFGECLCLSLRRVGHSVDSIIAFCSAFLNHHPTAAWCLKESGECNYDV
jgi:hypothetical protein